MARKRLKSSFCISPPTGSAGANAVPTLPGSLGANLWQKRVNLWQRRSAFSYNTACYFPLCSYARASSTATNSLIGRFPAARFMNRCMFEIDSTLVATMAIGPRGS
jgi:hypothetical protein